MHAAWYKANRAEERAKQSEYYKINAKQIKAVTKAYRLANLATAKRRVAEYAKRRPEVGLAAGRRWREKNPEVAKRSVQNRRARKAASGGTLSKNIHETLRAQQRGLCACCYKPLDTVVHLDHIVPIALGGCNEDWNVQLTHPKCNLMKSSKHPRALEYVIGIFL